MPTARICRKFSHQKDPCEWLASVEPGGVNRMTGEVNTETSGRKKWVITTPVEDDTQAA